MWVLLIGLQNFIRRLAGERDAPQIYEHRNTHRVDKLKLSLFFGSWRLVIIQENGIPDQKRVLKTELSRVHASNPSEQESFGLNILHFQGSEQLNV